MGSWPRRMRRTKEIGMVNGMTKKKAAAWLMGFALMILAPWPVYCLAGPYLQTENTENRQLAERPSAITESIQAYLEGHLIFRECVQQLKSDLKAYPGLYESYYNDHVPFRSQLIGLGSMASVELFGDASSD